MKTKLTHKSHRWAALPTLLMVVLLTVAGAATAGKPKTSAIVPPDATFHGRTYAEWSADALQWSLELPLDGHEALDTPDFDVRAGQRGEVWFLGGPFGTVERTVTIPKNKALFIILANAECSSLELPDPNGNPDFHGDTAAEQRDCAKYWADHIVGLFFEIDGVPIPEITSYRAVSPQYKFKAPTPWIFGETGGKGTSVGDGYYVLLEPLPKGEYTIHFGGVFHFTFAADGFDADSPIDMTYHVTVK